MVAVTESLLLSPIGRNAPSPALAKVAEALGEAPRIGAHEIVFARAGLAYYRSGKAGPVESVYWPAVAKGATSIPFPRGIEARMNDGDVRAPGDGATTSDLLHALWGGYLAGRDHLVDATLPRATAHPSRVVRDAAARLTRIRAGDAAARRLGALDDVATARRPGP